MRIILSFASLAFPVLSLVPVASAGGIAGGGGPPSLNLFKMRLVLDRSLTSEMALDWEGVLPDSIHVVNHDGETRSYHVHVGDQPGTYLLIDRREAIRAAVRPKP